MIRYILNIMKASCRQAWNNRKNYIFLSVTIVLTFSIIGFYMVYSDSEIYNTYKYTMKESSKIAFVQYEKNERNKRDLLLAKLDSLEDTHYYLSSEVQGITLFDHQDEGIHFVLTAKVVPNHVWAYYWSSADRMQMTDGSKSFDLKDDEIIICESLYKLIENQKDKNGDLFLNISRDKKLKVADVCEDYKVGNKVVDENGMTVYYFYGFATDKCMEGWETTGGQVVIHSKDIAKIEQYAADLGLRFSSNYNEKQDMNSEITNQIEIKEMILIALMVILGINMLSSFLNALNERKYEISIRRALGASKYGIVLQFLTEGLAVILIDILVSVAVVMALLSSVKLYHTLFLHEEWIINITGYSAMIFFLCCSFLALFFSILFSILSTRVEVIQYIKGE